MNADDFRRLALALPDAVEKSHMRHPDFRVGNKIFAALNANGTRGVVMLTPEQQNNYVQAEPEIFEPVNGGWGRRGCTTVHLQAAKAAITRKALSEAWQSASAKIAHGGRTRRRSASG